MKNKTGSVAPKERINIVYKPNDSGSKSNVELPMRFMVVGDFNKDGDGTPVSEKELISVNKENFGAVMKKLNVRADISVENVLDKKSENPLEVNLKFDSIKDFNPDEIVKRVPEMKKLLDVRNSLVALKGPVGNLPNLRKIMQNKVDNESERQGIVSELKLEHLGE